ncbi:hypothetical protein D7Y27_08025 [Corallococcus sp. AB004]|uniref:hypothetical protein n=1 Tax=Corallococcus TaxID=83461 RepID=UPI000EA04EBC|nr:MULTISPECIES: hypothetical protein [Corallococcus]NPC46780.1 hypothetical protein [Corallococcus exiguus]RKH87449.1 hypothetical protein D7X99_00665 [Corallococcus sp. AB032C]RKI46475.1 hypothetical protein D7Y27_08025 [Corallococcus sp. AB004]
MRIPTARSSAAWMVLCATMLSLGCGGPTEAEDPSLVSGDDNLGGAAGEAPAADGGTAPGGNTGITLCHIPPGNPANAHTITVGVPAVAAHLRHGDTVGACDDEGEPPTDGGTSEPDAGTTDGGSGGGIDAGPQCTPEGGECSTEGDETCCNSLSCQEGGCWPVIG